MEYDESLLDLIREEATLADDIPDHLVVGAVVVTYEGMVFTLDHPDQIDRMLSLTETLSELGIARIEWVIDEHDIHDRIQFFTKQILRRIPLLPAPGTPKEAS